MIALQTHANPTKASVAPKLAEPKYPLKWTVLGLVLFCSAAWLGVAGLVSAL